MTREEAKALGINLRYFLFAASMDLPGSKTAMQNNGSVRADFPSIKDLKEVVVFYQKEARNIIILSICEVSEVDYDKFFSEE